MSKDQATENEKVSDSWRYKDQLGCGVIFVVRCFPRSTLLTSTGHGLPQRFHSTAISEALSANFDNFQSQALLGQTNLGSQLALAGLLDPAGRLSRDGEVRPSLHHLVAPPMAQWQSASEESRRRFCAVQLENALLLEQLNHTQQPLLDPISNPNDIANNGTIAMQTARKKMDPI